MINEARFGFTDQLNFFSPFSNGQGYPDKLGVKEALRRPVIFRLRVVAATDDSVWGCQRGFGCVWRPVFRPRDAVLPEHCQTFAVQVEVDQGEVGAQPVMVLCKAPVSHLVEAEDPLEDAERMFYFGSHAGLTPVLLLL